MFWSLVFQGSVPVLTGLEPENGIVRDSCASASPLDPLPRAMSIRTPLMTTNYHLGGGMRNTVISANNESHLQ